MKTWFITGTSRGFGREWTLAALERGDRVVHCARRLDHYFGRSPAKNNDRNLIVFFEGTSEETGGSALYQAHPFLRCMRAAGVDDEQIPYSCCGLSHPLMQIRHTRLNDSCCKHCVVEGGAKVEFRRVLGKAIPHDRAGVVS